MLSYYLLREQKLQLTQQLLRKKINNWKLLIVEFEDIDLKM